MKYVGDFYSVSDKQYRVEFSTLTGSTTENIILSDNPAVISYQGEADNIYQPIIGSGSTIRLYTNKYMEDLYSQSIKDVKVEIKSGDEVVFTGYVTPMVYNQDYRAYKYDLEVECVDAISALKEIKYNVTTKDVKSFKDIIQNALSQVVSVRNFYVCEEDIKLNDLFISELNFYDEDEEPMTTYEVLEEVLRYCKLTMFMVGNDIYIVDIDKYTEDDCILYKYDGSWNNRQQIVSRHKVSLGTVLSGGTFSLSEIRNNFTVVGSPYNVSELLQDTLKPELLGKRPLDSEITHTKDYTGFSQGTKKQEWTHTAIYFDNLNPNLHLFQLNFNRTEYTGAHTPAQQNNYYSMWQFKSWGYDSGAIKDVGYPKKDNFNYYIGAKVRKADGDGDRRRDSDFFIRLTSKESCNIIPSGGFLCLNMDVMFARGDFMYVPEFADKLNLEEKIGNNPYFYAQIKIGNKYYNGSSWTTDSNNKVKIKLGTNGSYKHFTWHPVENTNTFLNNVDNLSGYIIKLPKDESLSGEIRIVVYTPVSKDLDGTYTDYSHIYVKNLKLDVAYPQQETEAFTDEEFKYDNKYNDFVNGGCRKGDDVDLKITTWDGSAVSLAAPFVKDGKGCLTPVSTLREQKQEFNIISSYLKQYKQPNIVVQATGTSLVSPKYVVEDEDLTYVVAASELNLWNEETNLTLIQKR